MLAYNASADGQEKKGRCWGLLEKWASSSVRNFISKKRGGGIEHALVVICSHSMGESMPHPCLSYPHTKSLYKKKPLVFWILLLLELSNPPKSQPQPPTFPCDKSQMYTHVKIKKQTNKLQGVFIPRERCVLHEVSAELLALPSHPGEMEHTKEKAGGHKAEHGRAC